MKLTRQDIVDLTDGYFIFHRGKMYFEQGRVLTLSAIPKDGTIDIHSIVKGTRAYVVNVSIDQDHEIDYHCGCPAFKTYVGACKHIVATLLAYLQEQEKVMEESKKRANHPVLDQLIKTYERRYDNDPIQILTEQKVSLMPFIGFIYRKPYLRFSVGQERQYLISDINKFIRHFLYREEVTYGKYLTLIHESKYFNESSQLILDFLFKFYDREDSYYDRRYFMLEDTTFDAFFELFKGKSISYDEKDGELSVSQDDLTLSLHVERMNDELFEVSFSERIDRIIETKLANYLIMNDTLYRLNPKVTKAVSPLIKVYEQHGELLLMKEDHDRFYAHVLTEVKDFVNIRMDESIEQLYEDVKPTAELYLDMPKRNRIVGQLKLKYNDEVVNPFQLTGNETRNRGEEIKIFSLLREFFSFDPDQLLFFIDDDDRMYRLYQEGIEELNKRIIIYASDDFHRKIRTQPQVNVQMAYRQSFLDLTIESNDIPMSEVYAILSSYRKRKKYHRLKDGTFIPLEEELFSDLDRIIQSLNLSEKEFVESDGHIETHGSRSFYIYRILENSQSIEWQADESISNYSKDIWEQAEDIVEPTGFRGKLRTYQKVGLNWLLTLTKYGLGGILADEMGLGKTIQIIAFLTHYYNEEQPSLPTLIITPASLVYNWQHELNQFSPNLKVLPIVGPVDERINLIKQIPENQVIITSYDYLKRDIDNYTDLEFMFTIIDEAQYIKNHQTQNARSVKTIKSAVRFALTGTPIENRLSELWSIFDFILPGYLYNYNYFLNHFEKPISNEDEDVTNALRDMVRPFILRRTKQEVLKDLPDKVESVVYVSFDDEERKLYRANLALLRQDLEDKAAFENINTNRILILSMLTRLRQLCCHPSLYYDNYEGSSAKLEACMDLIENSIASNHKILLFSQFTSMLHLIKEELEQRNISYFLLEGSTSKKRREQMVRQFNNDNTSVFLISLKAGGTGLNLTSADVVIHYDPWWNISAQNQATDRTHRIGQTQTVNVYKLIVKDTIEEKILKMQQEKQRLTEEIITSDDGIITRMTKEDIIKLFED